MLFILFQFYCVELRNCLHFTVQRLRLIFNGNSKLLPTISSLSQFEHTFIELTLSFVKCNLLSYWIHTHMADSLADTTSVPLVWNIRGTYRLPTLTRTLANTHTHTQTPRCCVYRIQWCARAHTHLPHILYSGKRRSRSRKKRQKNNIAYKTYCNMPFQAFHTY